MDASRSGPAAHTAIAVGRGGRREEARSGTAVIKSPGRCAKIVIDVVGI